MKVGFQVWGYYTLSFASYTLVKATNEAVSTVAVSTVLAQTQIVYAILQTLVYQQLCCRVILLLCACMLNIGVHLMIKIIKAVSALPLYTFLRIK